MLLLAVLSVSMIVVVGEGCGVMSPLRWAGRALLSILGVAEGCGVVPTLRWFALELEVCCEVCVVEAGFRCVEVRFCVFCCCFPFCKEVVGALMSGSVCLKLGNVAVDFPLLVLAGAFGAGLIEICGWFGIELGLTKCFALVSSSIRGVLLPLPLALFLVPLAGESPKSTLVVNNFFLITMSLFLMIAALQKVRVVFDCSIISNLYGTNRGFLDPL